MSRSRHSRFRFFSMKMIETSEFWFSSLWYCVGITIVSGSPTRASVDFEASSGLTLVFLRTFLLFCQNLANQVEFDGSKENYMIPVSDIFDWDIIANNITWLQCNQFIVKNLTVLRKFLENFKVRHLRYLESFSSFTSIGWLHILDCHRWLQTKNWNQDRVGRTTGRIEEIYQLEAKCHIPSDRTQTWEGRGVRHREGGFTRQFSADPNGIKEDEQNGCRWMRWRKDPCVHRFTKSLGGNEENQEKEKES